MMLSGLLKGEADFTRGTLKRAGGKWYFVTQGAWSSLPVEYRWVFDTSAEHYPEEGPAVLYGSMMGRDALAVVVQHGKAVGWFRADEPARMPQKQVAALHGLGVTKAAKAGCTPCSRCGGTGNIPQFNYYADGVCFWCGGTGCEPKTPPKRRREPVEETPIVKTPLQSRTGAGHIEYIKDWLSATFKAAGGYDVFDTPEEFEAQRWWHIAQALSSLILADDATLYPRAVKRAFQYARISKWPKAVEALDMNLGTALRERERRFEIPPGRSFNVPDVYRYDP